MRARHVSRPGPLAVPKDRALGRNVAPQAFRDARRVDQTTLLEAVVTEDRVLKIGSPKVAFYKVGIAKICLRKIAALKRRVYEPGSAKIRTGKVHVVQFQIAKRLRDEMLLFA
jgi:hypothetical protein